MDKSLFGRAPAGALAPAPVGAVLNACFGKGSALGAGQESESFLPAQEKPKKRASRGSLLWVHVV